MILTNSPFQIPEEAAEQPAWLQGFIDNKEPESSALDYKRGRALIRPNGDGHQKWLFEFTKDVSAMANSRGGLIIYGISEGKDEHGNDIPKEFSPLDPQDVTREALDQLISSHIAPKIAEVRIAGIEPPGHPGKVCWAIEIPQSTTAHQAKDFIYHRRLNTTTRPMEDYEIREVMGRRKWPSLEVKLRLRSPIVGGRSGEVEVVVRNTGLTVCHFFCVQITLPLFRHRLPYFATWKTEPLPYKRRTDSGFGTVISFSNESTKPLLPGLTYRRIEYFVGTDTVPDASHWLHSRVLQEVFADERPCEQTWHRPIDLEGYDDEEIW